MKKYILLIVLVIFAVGGAWYWYKDTTGGWYSYTGTAQIEAVSTEEIISRLAKSGCGKPDGIRHCAYRVNETTGAISVDEGGGVFGPSRGFVINGDVLETNLLLEGSKSVATFESGIEAEIERYGSIVTLVRGQTKITRVSRAADPRTVIY